MTYRDASPADAAALAVLARRTFTDTFGHLYTPENLAAFLASHTDEAWTALLADPARHIHVAEVDGELAGYISVGPPTLPIVPDGRPIELRQLYVLKPWQGEGVAAHLMDWAIARGRALGADAMYLSVFVDNARARRFYDRYGFTFVQTYAFMVGTHADEDHILRLAL
nr:GNAT family N-acetyltransferase [Allosphingosinicella indica]